MYIYIYVYIYMYIYTYYHQKFGFHHHCKHYSQTWGFNYSTIKTWDFTMKGTETTREIVILDLVGGPAFVGNAYSHSPVDNLNLYSLLNFDDGL